MKKTLSLLVFILVINVLNAQSRNPKYEAYIEKLYRQYVSVEYNDSEDIKSLEELIKNININGNFRHDKRHSDNVFSLNFCK